LSLLLLYFGGQFIVMGIDSYLVINLWKWVRYGLWFFIIVFIVYWLVHDVRHKKNKFETLAAQDNSKAKNS
jgi:hypothetical protein